MSELFLYDDAVARGFEPFALTRPISEMRAGAKLLRQRWEHALKMRASGVITSAHLASFDELNAPPPVSGSLKKGSIVANARFAALLAPLAAGDVWSSSGRVAAVALARDVDVEELNDGRVALEELARPDGKRVEVTGVWLDHVWDFIVHLAHLMTTDIDALAPGATRSGTELGSISGPHGVFAEEGAVVEPHVYFDTKSGPVLIRRNASVLAFTRVVGPCVIGVESVVGVDKISGSSIGEHCKVHGELSACVLLGHSNKSHDGFVGHSYLGRWVNLGAGTITSNLKNTYGTVSLWTPLGERDTGVQFLGTLFGDHAKTGIGATLNTGSVVGAGASIYGTATAPKVVPPFAWGDRPPYSTYELAKFLEVARRMMERRHVPLSEKQVRMLSAAHGRRWKVEPRA